MSKVFVNVPKQPGIRKNVISGQYQALKKIDGKQYAASFPTIREAQHWRNTFNGVEANEEISEPIGLKKSSSTLGHVWERFVALHFSSIQISTQRIWTRRFMFWKPLFNLHMEDITPTVINEFIDEQKQVFLSEEYKARGEGCSGRCNLDNEINIFNTVFNWYKREEEFATESKFLFTPIRPRHKKMGYIKDSPNKPENKKITVEAAFKFFQAFTNQLYADLAVTQFFCAGRIGEIAGIQIPNIYLEEDYLIIKESISWCNDNKMFEYLNPYPKNGESRRVHLHPILKEVIVRRLRERAPRCDFLFHVEGKPLNYCTIQANYRQAQRISGIPFRGTHCLRHGMATLARRVGGGLDAVIAMTGHKDLALADHYSKIDGEDQKKTSEKIVAHIRKLGFLESRTKAQIAAFEKSPLKLVK
ncbi:tyrosine-type recombinase/integrase [Bdellovibrio sp. HCB-162]|uniref:tyrosine-type recombinase/integrase n=1 Tax=Bdellovibrio sp. HCB-162 TaxID=3394234 RepID=UPI0039BCAA57